MKTVKFNKFFPDDNAFITVDGRMDKDDDWQVSLTIQSDTKNAVNWWCSDWNTEESGELKIIYRNGHFKNRTTLSEIRNRLK